MAVTVSSTRPSRTLARARLTANSSICSPRARIRSSICSVCTARASASSDSLTATAWPSRVMRDTPSSRSSSFRLASATPNRSCMVSTSNSIFSEANLFVLASMVLFSVRRREQVKYMLFFCPFQVFSPARPVLPFSSGSGPSVTAPVSRSRPISSRHSASRVTFRLPPSTCAA